MISGRIIRIISRKTVILNLGERDGVTETMRFAVYTPAEEIADPETGENLGLYRRRKTVVEADEVYDRFTLASRPTEFVRAPLAFPGITQSTSNWPDLPVSDREIEPLPSGNRVRVGDVVEEIADDDDDEGDDDEFESEELEAEGDYAEEEAT